MDLKQGFGIGVAQPEVPDDATLEYINLKLASLGYPTAPHPGGSAFHEIADSLLVHYRQRERLSSQYLCPVDWRIQRWLDEYFYPVSSHAGTGTDQSLRWSDEHLYPIQSTVRLPDRTFILDRHGLARALSLPWNGDEFHSEIISSYRLRQGVLHNPAKDRRTTQGVFHIAEGGLPIPADKVTVPRHVFYRLFQRALEPPESLLRLPFTELQDEKAGCFLSLFLRPLVCPAIPGSRPEKRMEIRFFAPGNLVSNLDFVESIFGNAGDPYLPENDAGLDVDYWSGHSGCVILAPHLTQVTKRDAGLPSYDEADEALRRSGFCWKDPDELYNEGRAFKLCARDEKGVIVTLIADNYFGYCKKEVKTQISYAANLYGLAEEEHAGGALVFPSYDLGEEFSGNLHVRRSQHSFEEVAREYRDLMDLQPEGYGIDKRFPDIYYVPEDVAFDLRRRTVSWPGGEKTQTLRLRSGITYIRPSGYKVRLLKPESNRSWRLVGTVQEGTFCHKHSTVSGAGKSEISKRFEDSVLYGPVFVSDLDNDLKRVAELLRRDYSDRYRDADKSDGRPILSFDRSLGSVIRLLTPSRSDYTEEYNRWLETIPQHIREMVFVLKRYYREEWGEDWPSHFHVDRINGLSGNELKCDDRTLVTAYWRVGFDPDGSWRTFTLRKDFQPAEKLSQEDDITASVVFASGLMNYVKPEHLQRSVKIAENCESRFFQRPDDAIIRGRDTDTEADLSQPGNFLSNFEPMRREDAVKIAKDSIYFDRFSRPMQRFIVRAGQDDKPPFFVSSAHPRVIDGRVSKNPRYLQTRPDLKTGPDSRRGRAKYIAEVGMRLYRHIPLNEPVISVVDSVVPGRRNNPPDRKAGIRALAVYNPIHYLELPEYLAEAICSLTGKSPSTTGVGSEGALTKGPFNAMPPVIDLNTLVVSQALTGAAAFLTSAGVLGPSVRMAHDISLLIPELWSRMSAEERDPEFLIREGFLSKCEDFEHDGKKLPFSLLGYRINRRFTTTFFGRIFTHPNAVFTDQMLKPELQDLEIFVEGLNNMQTTSRRIAEGYFEDGTVAYACPPLRAILHIMKDGHYEGKDISDPEIRRLFDRETILNSEWYRRRLHSQQGRESQLWKGHLSYLKEFLNKQGHADEAERLEIGNRYDAAVKRLEYVESEAYLKWLEGTVGRDEIERMAGNDS